MAIETIFAQGDDALGNQFRLSINPILTILPDPIEFRTVSVSIPAQNFGTYEVKYRTQKFTKPNGSITTENQFTFVLRVDKYWAIYHMFNTWLNTIANHATGIMAPDVLPGGVAPFRTTCVVQSVNSAGIPTSGVWTFLQAYPSDISGMEFAQDTDTPLQATITMQYLKMIAI